LDNPTYPRPPHSCRCTVPLYRLSDTCLLPGGCRRPWACSSVQATAVDSCSGLPSHAILLLVAFIMIHWSGHCGMPSTRRLKTTYSAKHKDMPFFALRTVFRTGSRQDLGGGHMSAGSGLFGWLPHCPHPPRPHPATCLPPPPPHALPPPHPTPHTTTPTTHPTTHLPPTCWLCGQGQDMFFPAPPHTFPPAHTRTPIQMVDMDTCGPPHPHTHPLPFRTGTRAGTGTATHGARYTLPPFPHAHRLCYLPCAPPIAHRPCLPLPSLQPSTQRLACLSLPAPTPPACGSTTYSCHPSPIPTLPPAAAACCLACRAATTHHALPHHAGSALAALAARSMA